MMSFILLIESVGEALLCITFLVQFDLIEFLIFLQLFILNVNELGFGFGLMAYQLFLGY